MLDLKENDVLYLEELQRDYENTVNYYEDISIHMKEWEESIGNNKHFLTTNGLLHDIRGVEVENVNKTTRKFITYVLNYFESEYGLSSLSNFIQGKIVNKYVKYDYVKANNDGLNYKDVIRDICQELNINNFDSAKVNDLRDRIKEKTKYYFENNRIIQRNNKLKITDYGFSLDYNWSNSNCGLTDNSKDMFIDIASALNYKNTKKLYASDDFKRLINILAPTDWNERLTIGEFHKSFDIKKNGIVSIRFYKNRSLELTFSNEGSLKTFISVLKGEF